MKTANGQESPVDTQHAPEKEELEPEKLNKKEVPDFRMFDHDDLFALGDRGDQ